MHLHGEAAPIPAERGGLPGCLPLQVLLFSGILFHRQYGGYKQPMAIDWPKSSTSVDLPEATTHACL